MAARMDMTGKVYGRLTVIRSSEPVPRRPVHWVCKCECGTEKIINGNNLRRGSTNSCGCLQKDLIIGRQIKHGFAGTGTYKSWHSMIQRCSKVSKDGYKRYGGAGITVCERWARSDGFKNFLKDMGDRPENATLDRINPSGGYGPENCRWATRSAQSHNKRKKACSSSKFIGVYKVKDSERWCGQLKHKEMTVWNKLFDSEIKAAEAYDAASFALYGDRPNGMAGLI